MMMMMKMMMLLLIMTNFHADSTFLGAWADPSLEETRNGRSMYETLDQLVRGDILTSDLPPLEVVHHHGKLWSVDNRRLQVLKWFQACHQDQTVWVCCKITRPTQRFWEHWNTTSDSLSICPRQCIKNVHTWAHLYSIQQLKQCTRFLDFVETSDRGGSMFAQGEEGCIQA